MGRDQFRQLGCPGFEGPGVDRSHARKLAGPLPPPMEIAHEGLDPAADLILCHARDHTDTWLLSARRRQSNHWKPDVSFPWFYWI